MLANILPEGDYPANKRLFIVDMMRKFELCYDIVPEQTFLVPDLLPKDEPYTGEWEGALAFQYHYNVLPSSIISRFIVRMNGFIHKTVWRSGVVLKKDGNTALVKADTEERKIYIWVNGDEHTRRDFLSAIRAEFDAIHKTIIKIEAVQKVPHPDYPDLVLDYAELLQFERDGIADFPRSVDGKTVMVNVRQLLNGVRIGSEAVSVRESTAPITPAPVAEKKSEPVPASAPQLSMPVKILRGVFVEFPKIVGRIPLDIVGKSKDAADSTMISLGYGIIILILLVVFGYVGLDALITMAKDIWRFFFPVKQ
jgi:internalin A